MVNFFFYIYPDRYLHQKSAPLNITTPWSSTGWTHILPRDTQMVLTPLTAACAYGHKEIVEYLVENGVGVCGGSVFVSVVGKVVVMFMVRAL